MLIKLVGKRWRVRFVSRMADEGRCDPPDQPHKTISIARRLRGERQLDVLLHELLHACNWQLAEEHITQIATDIARALWRLGYRQTEAVDRSVK
jgi:hypothetical protein